MQSIRQGRSEFTLCFLAWAAISKHHREGLNNTHLFFKDLEAGHSEQSAVGLVSGEACSGLADSSCLAMSSHRKEHVLWCLSGQGP